jgi:predicted cobalt transporter CbtA
VTARAVLAAAVGLVLIALRWTVTTAVGLLLLVVALLVGARHNDGAYDDG